MTDRRRSAQAVLSRPVDWAGMSRFLVLSVIAGVVLLPLIATAFGGFKGLGELRANPFGVPWYWETEHYGSILFNWRLWRYLGNSLLIGCLTVLITLITGSMAAFVFAHIRFFGDRYLRAYFMLGLLFPAAT